MRRLRLIIAALLALAATPGGAFEADLASLEGWGFSGTSAHGQGTTTQGLSGHGLADWEAGLAFNPDTHLPWLSLSKPLTAALLLRLEAGDALTLDDPLHRHLPDVPRDKRGIRLHQLLSHSSGLAAQLRHPGFDGPPEFEPLEREAFLERVMRSRPLAAPGEAFIYSNLGYNLAAAVAESSSGEPLDALLAEEILKPAGLVSVRLGGPPAGQTEAVGYSDGQRWGRFSERAWPDGRPGWNLIGAGGLTGNSRDLIGLVQMLRGGPPMRGELGETWREPRLTLASGEAYALGLSHHRDDFGRRIGHEGGFGPFTTELAWWPESERWLVLSSNTRSFHATDVLAALVRSAATGKAIPEPPSARLPPAWQGLDDVLNPGASQSIQRVTHPDGDFWLLYRKENSLRVLACGGQAVAGLLEEDERVQSLERGRAVMDRLRALLSGSAHRPEPRNLQEARLMRELRETLTPDSASPPPLWHQGSRPAPDGRWWTDVRIGEDGDRWIRIVQNEAGDWQRVLHEPGERIVRAVFRHAGQGRLQGLETTRLQSTAAWNLDMSALKLAPPDLEARQLQGVQDPAHRLTECGRHGF
ncbi:serine hydrolase domain-containing protein [Gammaproteobacteria bacterium AB-CW1]|uniref:Serine hydrolase domain-containing protein n=1 Tax=Natronospira elongata TaxID=3110268 RepID=A0AAP6MMM9_9GAMM|nr:serine hydrolase domain-containing protein [Gammaproteobacteria bacterium AB-CW1]